MISCYIITLMRDSTIHLIAAASQQHDKQETAARFIENLDDTSSLPFLKCETDKNDCFFFAWQVKQLYACSESPQAQLARK